MRWCKKSRRRADGAGAPGDVADLTAAQQCVERLEKEWGRSTSW